MNVPCHQQLDWVHPSEPNDVWTEAGLAKLTVPLNRRDDPPFPNNIVTAQHLSQLLQEKGLAWRSYQEDIDLAKDLMGQVTDKALPASEWTVPLIPFSGASPAYGNCYDPSRQYNYQPKHNPPLFFEDTNGGNDPGRNNPMAKNYAPLQQLESDLTNSTVARYNWITPNIHNDMHSSSKTDLAHNGVTYAAGTDEQQIALGDNFLSKIVPLVESSQAFRNNGPTRPKEAQGEARRWRPRARESARRRRSSQSPWAHRRLT
ncbi:MAG: alkaline phosphatase family protein [Roseiarcus sp.]